MEVQEVDPLRARFFRGDLIIYLAVKHTEKIGWFSDQRADSKLFGRFLCIPDRIKRVHLVDLETLEYRVLDEILHPLDSSEQLTHRVVASVGSQVIKESIFGTIQMIELEEPNNTPENNHPAVTRIQTKIYVTKNHQT